MGSTGVLKPGSKNFFLTLTNAKGGPGVSAFFIAGLVKQTTPFGGGCDLLVAPLLLFRLPVAGLPGAGNGSTSLRIPLDPKFKGVTLHLQWGVIDSAAKGIGIAFSNGGTVKL